MLACYLHQYYALNPGHRQIINRVPAFCSDHTGLIAYTPDNSGGKLSLPKHCCNFLRKCCDKKSNHQGFLHCQVPPGAVHCQHGSKCSFGHWAMIQAQAKASPKGKGKGKCPAPTAQLVAAHLALYAHQMGGSLRGSEVGDYYKVNPAHKDFIASPGLKNFCSEYDGLFAFELDKDSGRVRLASFCCHFLRDACNHGRDHPGRQHVKPQSSLVACHLRAECPHGHWKRILQVAAGKPPSGRVGPEQELVQSAGSKEVEVPVSQIRWSHDSVRVLFQDGRLVVTMLKELLDGDLLPLQIPQIEVLEDENILYAWSGNRRLWVLKEFQRLRKEEVTVKVKKKSSKLNRKSPKFSTTCDGESVTFFSTQKRDDFPSMSFALAAINLVTAPTGWDVELGHQIRLSSGLPFWKIQRMGELGAWSQTPPSQDLQDYLWGKPYLFTITKGEVDQVVGLTCCMDAFRLLGFDTDPLKMPALQALEEIGQDLERL